MKYTLLIAIILCPTFIMTLTVIASLANLPEFKANLGDVFLLGISIFLLCILINLIKDLNLVKKHNPKKAQYGVLQEKYITKEQNEDSTKNYFYADILFLENCTIIKRVETSRSLFYSLKAGDRVLVVSFNGKEAFCLKAS